MRDGAEKTLSVTPEERESVEAPVNELPRSGITASNLTSWSAKELKRADRIRRAGPRRSSRRARREAKPSLNRDDVIVAIDGKPIADVAALVEGDRARWRRRPRMRRSRCCVTFDRRSERLLTVVDVGRVGPARSGARGAQGLGAGERPGADAGAGRQARLAGRPACASPACSAAGRRRRAAGRRHHHRDRRRSRCQASQPTDAELFATMIRQYKIGSTVQAGDDSRQGRARGGGHARGARRGCRAR